MTISRRKFIVATTFVAAGLATGTAVLGAEGARGRGLGVPTAEG